jgi:zinc transporter
MNQTMLVLAAVTTVFMPLNLMTGLLGMNVAGIPLADHPWSFSAVCAASVIIALTTFWIMHKKNWL